MGSITETLKKHRKIALDTSLWIYHFEDHPQFGNLSGEILTAVAKKRCHAVISELTLMELVTGPLKLNRQDIADEYELLLTHYPNLTLVPISRDILMQAAEFRALYYLKTPDAIILSTAKESHASLFVTNDQSWPDFYGMEILCLSEVAS